MAVRKDLEVELGAAPVPALGVIPAHVKSSSIHTFSRYVALFNPLKLFEAHNLKANRN